MVAAQIVYRDIYLPNTQLAKEDKERRLARHEITDEEAAKGLAFLKEKYPCPNKENQK